MLNYHLFAWRIIVASQDKSLGGELRGVVKFNSLCGRLTGINFDRAKLVQLLPAFTIT